ncbi:hypothetical protein SPRG_04909 [Saprolegnia parasitica CBS 223.65]|uniref:Uncharacterized protein n=1 Tax=Saprolegnia parasitica (strain CBS 223.65) TaxID=695850 RepID=A0A067CKT2_SAPPC|nr:hypothetical protein SPRG_04909 [Saprolegnia parasitica CBS 223.65]KDO29795.1 hypothetical protein SPRG_04909 [Saprolegnia parasitica CBS 223.65]|eukprot:XP_012199438.1 hypothetical protein SPRG_04909 [Saprolegnia parasitica CBS 223.65]
MADTVAPTTLRPASISPTSAWSPGTNVTASPSPAPSPSATPTPIMTPAMTTSNAVGELDDATIAFAFADTGAFIEAAVTRTHKLQRRALPNHHNKVPRHTASFRDDTKAETNDDVQASNNRSARAVKAPVVDAINDTYPYNDTANDRGPNSNASASTPWIIAADVAGCLLVLFLLVQYRRDVLQRRMLTMKDEATSPTYLPADSPFCYDDYKPSELEQAEPRFQSSELIFAINTGGTATAARPMAPATGPVGFRAMR